MPEGSFAGFMWWAVSSPSPLQQCTTPAEVACPCAARQAIAGAAQVQAVKQQRARLAAEAEAAGAGADDEDNVLIHWVRSAADMRLKVRALEAGNILAVSAKRSVTIPRL